MEVGAYQAKTHLPELLERVASGERIPITKRGKVIAELRPVPLADKTALREAKAKLDERRRARPAGRKPITVAEIVAAKNQGRR